MAESANKTLQENRLKHLVAHMPYGVSVWKLSSDSSSLVYVNDKFSAEVGSGNDELIGKEANGVLPFGDHDNQVFSAMKRSVSGGSCEIIKGIPCRHGDLWFKVSVFPLDDEHVACVYENATVQRRLERKLRQMALEDSLTGLTNLRGFKKQVREALTRSERNETMVGIMFCDLDGFKAINDTHGHETGDVALKVIAGRLRDSVRKADCVGRLGGDEFGVVLEGMTRKADVEPIAQKIISTVSGSPVELGGGRFADVGISVGIAMTLYVEDDIEATLQSADTAMYEAKQSGGNRYVFKD